MSKPLDGIKVLDLTRLLPGPFCSLILADFGAEVIKIEPPGAGDYLRLLPPLIEDTSGAFLMLNRNKKSITLNMKAPAAKEIFMRLAREADVILEGNRPGVVKKLGIDYDTVKEINPGIVYCSISGYGQDGPYFLKAGHDINYLSYAGILGLTGHKNERPAIPGVQIADVGGGALMAVIGVLMGLMARKNTGLGQYIDISMMDGALSWLALTAGELFAGGPGPRRGDALLLGKYACYNTYRTKDGNYISLGAIEGQFWMKLCQHFGRDDLIGKQYDEDAQEEVYNYLQSQFETKTRDEWMAVLDPLDVCAAPVYELHEVPDDPHVKYRKMVFEADFPRYGKVKQLGFPVKMSGTPAEVYLEPPQLGQHTDEILAGLGYSKEEIEAFHSDGTL